MAIPLAGDSDRYVCTLGSSPGSSSAFLVLNASCFEVSFEGCMYPIFGNIDFFCYFPF